MNMYNLCSFPGQHQSTPAHLGVHWAAWWTRTRQWWHLLMGPRPAAHQVNSGSRRGAFDRSGIVTTWVERTCIHHLTCPRVMVRDTATTHTNIRNVVKRHQLGLATFFFLFSASLFFYLSLLVFNVGLVAVIFALSAFMFTCYYNSCKGSSCWWSRCLVRELFTPGTPGGCF